MPLKAKLKTYSQSRMENASNHSSLATELHSMGKDRVLEATDIVAGYGDAEILHGVSVDLGASETVSVIGPNGSGKSTLLKSIVGLVKVRSGSVRLEGDKITNLQPEQIVRHGVGYVPQTENVFPSLTIRENLQIGAYIRDRRSVNKALDRVLELFPALMSRSRMKAGLLSGGERQMLAMARGLMVDPKIMLLDEPSAALSPKLRRLLFDKIAEIGSSGVAILLVEQNARISLAMSNRAYVLAMGKNELHGDARTLLNNQEVGRLYLGR